MKLRWDKLGGQLGVLFCVAGIVLVWAGWNGAASYDDVPSQFPYLIAGGIAGLCLVMIGVGLFIVQSQREERATLEANLIELRQAIERMGQGVAAVEQPVAAIPVGDVFLAGPNAYHRTGCHLLEGREGLATLTLAAAQASGLTPCRTCGADQT